MASAPHIMDIEASGFGPDSYPIEVGVAFADGSRFCTLITPQPGWTHWSEEAEALHHVSREILEKHGRPVTQVAQLLNDLLAHQTVYSDAWTVDKPWLNSLFEAAGVSIAFTLSSIELLLTESQLSVWDKTRQAVLDETPMPRHRASNDAAVIQQTFERVRLS